ncbi:hypothetical protein [Niabella hibiscisoli]|uniref:hypothetical protein n=1 Tax=Niabella hibiscisoli TaxID=1825928 RepID=UPI001F0F137F|nr:hypothetical protein [Niabella hibiscisoli]MCH5717287.1 hypothetical protein [Niabella hibiscisoli]
MEWINLLKNWKRCIGLAVLLNLLVFTSANAQRIATLRATTTGKELFNIPMQTALDAITTLPDSSLQLVEIRNGQKVNIPFQITSTSDGRNLCWMIAPSVKASRVFELIRVAAKGNFPMIQAKESNGALVLEDNGKELLQYHFETVYPPAGIDTA